MEDEYVELENIKANKRKEKARILFEKTKSVAAATGKYAVQKLKQGGRYAGRKIREYQANAHMREAARERRLIHRVERAEKQAKIRQLEARARRASQSNRPKDDMFGSFGGGNSSGFGFGSKGKEKPMRILPIFSSGRKGKKRKGNNLFEGL